MAKILVTGASGLLGSNAVLHLGEHHEVVGVYHQHAIYAPDVRCLAADLSIPGKAERILVAEKPDWVLHCAAAADVDGCERDPDKAFRLNRDMAGYVAGACSMGDVRLIHISTDLVFDGAKGDYSEEDPTNPVNVYGKSKLAGEFAVLTNCPNSCVIRTNIYGWNAFDKLSLAEWFLNMLKTKGEAPGFVDMFSTPILINDLLEIIEALFQTSAQGIFHIGSADCISKYEFGREIAGIYGYTVEAVVPVHWREVGLYAERADNLCLDGQKIINLRGIALPEVRQGLARWKTYGEGSYHRRLKSLVTPPGNEALEVV